MLLKLHDHLSLSPNCFICNEHIKICDCSCLEYIFYKTLLSQNFQKDQSLELKL